MKFKLNFFVNMVLVVLTLVCGSTGVLKIRDLHLSFTREQMHTLSFIHDWSGILSLFFYTLHGILHARWFPGAFRKILGNLFSRKTSG